MWKDTKNLLTDEARTVVLIKGGMVVARPLPMKGVVQTNIGSAEQLG